MSRAIPLTCGLDTSNNWTRAHVMCDVESKRLDRFRSLRSPSLAFLSSLPLPAFMVLNFLFPPSSLVRTW